MMEMNTYTPTPVDVKDIELPERLIDLVEMMAKNVHDEWAAARIKEGWKYGKERNERLLTHPCLVPYEHLPYSEKEYDRKTAVTTLKFILKSGFTIS